MSCGLRILWSDERISCQISPCRLQLIRSSESADSIDESWHLILCFIRRFHLLNFSPRTNRSRRKTLACIIPLLFAVSKCRRNRVVDLVVDGTNRKETLFFTFKMFHLKRLPAEDVKTATVKNGTKWEDIGKKESRSNTEGGSKFER